MLKKIFSFVVLLFYCSANAQQAPELGAYNVDSSNITVSGISSGGFMAVQLGVAYSKTFRGVGSIAGGIYGCSEGDPQKSKGQCMSSPSQINTQNYIDKTVELATKNLIDATENLKSQKIYLYASPQDYVVKSEATDKLEQFYLSFMSQENIIKVNSINSAHGFPTVNQGNLCQLGFMPWILNCNYDAAGEILKTMYGTLNEKIQAPTENIKLFNQKTFTTDTDLMHEQGWIYVPSSCQKNEKCRLHIALHGCQMNPDFIKDSFVKMAGYNEWAENNNIIVLYPQAAKKEKTNPYGCWDWFGISGPNYIEKSAPEMQAIYSMIQKIMNHP